MKEEQKYICIFDNQDSDFCLGRTLTINEWKAQIICWLNTDYITDKEWFEKQKQEINNFVEQDVIYYLNEYYGLEITPLFYSKYIRYNWFYIITKIGKFTCSLSDKNIYADTEKVYKCDTEEEILGIVSKLKCLNSVEDLVEIFGWENACWGQSPKDIYEIFGEYIQRKLNASEKTLIRSLCLIVGDFYVLPNYTEIGIW